MPPKHSREWLGMEDVFDPAGLRLGRMTRLLGHMPGIFGRRRVPQIAQPLSMFIYYELEAKREIPVDGPVLPRPDRYHRHFGELFASSRRRRLTKAEHSTNAS